ncbi:hypothetical protein [Chondromyces apiculatus]|uniref:Outer membrane protein OmpA n=1 Tax=Chondromyces apiculatus DSM 436 TaxID=1192034 RepID=A0A017SZG2_9BACT|nr:hypothetical protein [Chondromyces apiculatus]EYF02137.1 outer membrane protein OmpA [Chondromyces apiculatus DSM 436]
MRHLASSRLASALATALTLVGSASAAEDEPITLEFDGRVGMAVRADDPPDLAPVDRVGLDLEAAAYLAPTPSFSLGLAFQHLGLGRERSATSDLGTFEVSRDMNALWAALRLDFGAGGRAGMGIEIGPGLAWQSVDLVGVTDLARGSTNFSCSGNDRPGLGLRAGLSGWVTAGSRFALTAGAGAEVLSLSSDVIDACATGAGSTVMLGLRFGVAYRLDVRPFISGGGRRAARGGQVVR